MRRSTSWWRASSGEWLALTFLLLSCTTRETRPARIPEHVTLFFSAEVRGFLGPCGCSENMRGGIARTAHVIEQARQEPGAVVHFFDCGSGLFGEPSLPDAAVPQQQRKAKALAEAWKTMGLEARVPGPLDDAAGAPFRQALGLPSLPERGFEVVDGVGVLRAADLPAAAALATQARSQGARFVVALVSEPFPALLAASDSAKGIDLVLSSRAKDALSAEENRLAGASTKVVQLQSKGRSLLRVDVRFHGDGAVEWVRGDAERDREVAALDERIELLRAQENEPMLAEARKALVKAKLEEILQRRETLAATPTPTPEDRSSAVARLIPLESTVAREPKVAAIEAAYDRDVGLLNLAWAKEHGTSCPAATPEKPGIVGSAKCITCHHEEGEVWRQTKHPQAYTALTAVGKENHLDCVACHVTGWQQPQGVCRIDQTVGRTEVGCESCHGPGSAHAEAPTKQNIRAEVASATCTQCHDRENSPHFDFETWLPKVLGPGHGQ